MKSASKAAIALAVLAAFSLPVTAQTYKFRQVSVGLVSPIVQAAPTIGAFTVPAKTMGNPAFALTAPTSNSPGAFTYTSSNPAVATVSGSTVTLVAAGSTQITAAQAATEYFLAGSATATLTVAAAPLPPGYVVVNGLTWMPASATGYTYSGATALCAGTINGTTGWRMPNQADVTPLHNAKVAGTSGLTPGGWQVNYWWTTQFGGTGKHTAYALPDNNTSMYTAQDLDSTLFRATCVK